VRLLALVLAALLVVGLLPAPGAATTERTAVLDRFEGDRAVLVSDADERFVVPRSAVPPEGRHVDAVFHLTLQDGRVVGIRYDPRETRQRERRSQARFDALAEDAPDGSDDGPPATGDPDDDPIEPPVPLTLRTGGSRAPLLRHLP